MPSTSATSAARRCPAATSSPRMRLRIGWAIARRIRGSLTRPLLPAPLVVLSAMFTSLATHPHGLLRTLSCAMYGAHMPTSRNALRNHDFAALWIGQTVSEVGSRMSMFVFPLLAYALPGSTLWAATAEAAHLVGLCATLLPAGVLADRLDVRRVMRAA